MDSSGAGTVADGPRVGRGAWRVACAASLVLAVLVVQTTAGEATPSELEHACPVGSSTVFTDVGPADTHAAAIDCLVAWSITAGLDAQRFGPDRAVTRAQMATFLARLLRSAGDPMMQASTEEFVAGFEDVLPDAHRVNIMALWSWGLVEGRLVGDRLEFRAGEPVTRAQMATFLRRSIEHLGFHLPEAESQFEDIGGNVHAPAIGALANAGVVQGRTADRYDPNATVTRAQMATFLMRTADLLVASGVAELPPTMTGPLPGAPETDVLGPAMAGGALHTCARLEDGGVACWGQNSSGQLGDGTFQDRLTPVRVLGVTDAVEVAAGTEHSCARHADGTVSCWGWGHVGQLGDGLLEHEWMRNAPHRIPGLSDVIGLSAMYDHTCAVHRDGGVSCWGNNYHGELADGVHGPASARAVPLRSPFIRDAVQVAAGSHTCARHRDGTVSCWGSTGPERGSSQPADPDQWLAWAYAPAPVLDVDDAVEITAGSAHTCARRSDGSVWCWGTNVSGSVGDGTDRPRPFPTRSGDIDDATGISAGFGHTCAVHGDGSASCWGDGRNGQLGDGTEYNLRLAPSPVADLTDATSIMAGFWQTCATRASGTPVCWGWNTTGTVGDGSTTERRVPVPVAPVP